MITPQRHASWDGTEHPPTYQAAFPGQVASAQPLSPAIHTSLLQKMAQHNAFLSDNNHQSDPDIASIDSDIATHLESIRQLCTKRNSLVPISRLPSEVLANIFIQYAKKKEASLGYPLRRPKVWWIAITYVCRHWREVAVATPSLWCSLPFHRPKWVPEMIIRSKMAPLEVIVTSPSSRLIPQIRMALVHMSRIQDLVLEMKPSDLKTLPLSSPAPLLNSVRICNRITPDGFPLPKDVFGFVTPSLRRLDLTGCTLSWDSPMFSGLTSLSVSLASGQESGRSTLTTLLDVLRCNTRLESLSLINCLSPMSSDSGPRHATVLLPILRALHLQGEALCCSHLLSSLSVPTTMTLKLSSSAPILSHFTSLFASAKDLGISTPILSLQISSIWSAVTLRGYDHPLASSDLLSGKMIGTGLRSDVAPHIDICLGLNEIPSEPASAFTESILTQGCSTMNLTYLEEIHANTADGASVGAMKGSWWRGLFEKLEGVRTLIVVGRACFEVLTALGKRELRTVGPARPAAAITLSSSCPSLAPDNVAGSSILLPNLRTLSIEDANLKESFSYDDNRAPFFKFLMNTLTWRKQGGKRVEMLVLKECRYINPCDVDLIEGMVGDVGWDGPDNHEGYPDLDDEDFYDRGLLVGDEDSYGY
ncbi:hypothetical protein JAAARDRAFT_171604, partial [Jaapia argillacea MUCL 33604]